MVAWLGSLFGELKAKKWTLPILGVALIRDASSWWGILIQLSRNGSRAAQACRTLHEPRVGPDAALAGGPSGCWLFVTLEQLCQMSIDFIDSLPIPGASFFLA